MRRRGTPRSMKRAAAVLGIWIVASATAADASCIAVPPEVLTVEVRSCSEISDFAAQRLAGVPLRWAVELATAVVAEHPGVVLEVRIGERRTTESLDSGELVVGPPEEISERGRFFLARKDLGACEHWPSGRSALLLREWPCCDVNPPSDVPCALSLDLLVPLPEELRRQIEED